MATTDLTIEVHEVGRRTGEWCDVCALPSVVEIDIALVDTRKLSTVSRHTSRFCTENVFDGED